VQRAVRARFIHWRIPRLLALSKYKRINRTNARLLIILHLEFSPSADLFAIAPAMRFNIVASRHVAWQRAKHRSTAGFCMPAERSVVPWMFSERERGAGIRYRGSNRASGFPLIPYHLGILILPTLWPRGSRCPFSRAAYTEASLR